MAEEFVSAFHATNNEKLVEFVHSYYVNNLNSPEFCSALQLRLNPTNNQQPGNNPTLIAQNFLQDISRLHSKHLTMEMKLITMEKKLSKQLHSVAVSKKLYSLLFNAAAAGPVLFAAVGRWRRSVLVKRETALKKRKEIVDRMILVARPIVTGLDSIVNAARGLEVEIKSLSEAVDDGEKVAAVENCFEELLQNDEKYNRVINCAKELVLQSIVLVGNKGTEHYFL
ncbi:hypothetical protein SASPL_139018 [Salvia splendens]|uniref:Uncharacterized protein n=1 Tax=Salvia splendens TaxID=180675 RepID=A0A8X8WVT9_SALSN|nr:uncharacterized protein LOC121763593 [Salvia splendens]KAG6402143.1 hypothetical protein SASPL_139018 [Salvia splendens]